MGVGVCVAVGAGVGVGGALVGLGVLVGCGVSVGRAVADGVADGMAVAATATFVAGRDGVELAVGCVPLHAPSNSASSNASVSRRSSDVFMPAL